MIHRVHSVRLTGFSDVIKRKNRFVENSGFPVTGCMRIGDRIRTRREALRLSQKELGKRVGRGQTTVNGWEQNIHGPTRPVIEKLASVLHTSVQWLVSGVGPETDGRSLTTAALPARISADALGYFFTLAASLTLRRKLTEAEQAQLFDDAEIEAAQHNVSAAKQPSEKRFNQFVQALQSSCEDIEPAISGDADARRLLAEIAAVAPLLLGPHQPE